MLFVLYCGPQAHALHSQIEPHLPSAVGVVNASHTPTRGELKFLDGLHDRFVTGHTPTLDEIAAQPDVAHQGAPQPDPHPVSEQVRILVCGNDAAVAAVVTKLMRIDALWVQVAYLPLEESDVSRAWGVDTTIGLDELLPRLVNQPATPRPVIRDDHGLVTLAKATITGITLEGEEQPQEMIGEVIVDSATIYQHLGANGAGKAGARNNGAGKAGSGTGGRGHGGIAGFNNGVTLATTANAPGLVAIPRKPLASRAQRRGFLSRLRSQAQADKLHPTISAGRALQAGGVDMQVVRDSVPHPRPLKSVTFYRHLRDGQFVTFDHN